MKNCSKGPSATIIAGCGVLLSAALLVAGLYRPGIAAQPVDQPVAQAGTSTLLPTSRLREPAVAAVVADAARDARHTALDALHQPDAVLAFARVAEGMVVLEWGGNDGYYTELLARAVGPAGHVYVSQLREGARARKLRNVVLVSDALVELADSSVDIAFSHLNYHTRFHPAADRQAHLQAAHRVLQLGGMLVVIDHAAMPGSLGHDAVRWQRVDEELVAREVQRRGFLFEEASDVLRNAADDRERPIDDAALHGATDRFALRFVRVGGLDTRSASGPDLVANSDGRWPEEPASDRP